MPQDEPPDPSRLKPVLARLAAGGALDEAAAEAAFGTIMDGAATAAQIAALAMALRVRGETVADIVGAARAMRARMQPVALASAPGGDSDAIDVCGTGGDGADTLNVSTAVTFVVAGTGVRVAKHGNRAASGRTGGADVLAALGIRLEPPLHRLPAIMAAAGCVFLFAPRHHPALRHAAPVRRDLGLRTIFNLLGPLANPAGVRRQLIGVGDPAWSDRMAQALARLGCRHALVVHGQPAEGGGMDELTIAGPNQVTEQRGTTIQHYDLHAGPLGLRPAPLATLRGGDAAHNAAALADLLGGGAAHAAYRDTVLLNAAAALVVAGRADDVPAALPLARASLDTGSALAVLHRLRAASEFDG